MRPAPKRRPIDHVTPRLGPERVERMWTEIARAQAPSRARWLWVAAAALLLGVWRVWPAAELASGDVVAVATVVSLPDGSELRTGEATELRVEHADPERVGLRLTRGRVHCEVSHRAQRSFAVYVGELAVLVRGTAFSVEALGDEVRVQVERGSVEVRVRETRLASLSAGESWSSRRPPVDVSEPEVIDEPALEVQQAPTPAPEPRRKRSHAAPARETAESLLERANEARLAGDPRSAADLYQQLRVTYPDDARAGLSAFELARISLHSLHDRKRALDALDFALAHGRGFAREDAEALQVEALEGSACLAARTRFLLTYAKSAQRARVARACE